MSLRTVFTKPISNRVAKLMMDQGNGSFNCIHSRIVFIDGIMRTYMYV